MAAKTILVIDDDRSMRDLLRRLIAREGFTVKTWSKGLRALNVIDDLAPDFVLTDYDLGPGPDGLEIALYARSKGIDVLLVSGDPYNRMRAFECEIPFIEKQALSGFKLKKILAEVKQLWS